MPALNTPADLGTRTLKAYCDACGTPTADRMEDYTIADAIAALLHLAAKRGFDAEEVVASALGHYRAEAVKQ